METETIDSGNILKSKPELGFIINILNGGNPNLLDSFVKAGLKQDEIIRLVKHHRLDSILYREIEKQKIVLPKELKARLEQINKRNKMRMLKLTSELIRIHQLFTENNIDYISLKGPALSQQIYGDYTVRCSKDLDILVAQEYIDKSTKLLATIGYISKMNNSSIKRLSDKDLVFHNSEGIMLELHYRLFNNKYLLPSPLNILSNLEYTEINNANIHTLPKWFYLLYQIGHSASHNWSRMVWSLDVIRYKKLLSRGELMQCENYAKNVGLDGIVEQSKTLTLNSFINFSHEEHYHSIKKFIFLLSLNSTRTYKWQELLQRFLMPYRIFRKYLF